MKVYSVGARVFVCVCMYMCVCICVCVYVCVCVCASGIRGVHKYVFKLLCNGSL